LIVKSQIRPATLLTIANSAMKPATLVRIGALARGLKSSRSIAMPPAKECQSDDEGAPVGDPPLHELPGYERREHRHFALGEIEMVDRLVDHDHCERHTGIDRAGGDASQDLIGEKLHGRAPQ